MPTQVYKVYMQVPHRGWPGPYFDYQPDMERIEQALVAIQSRLGYVSFMGGDVVSSEAEVEAMLRGVDWQAFGHHRVAFYGDHRQKIKDLATLIGFEVVEKDK